MSIGAFAGRGFSEVVMELFRQHGVVLLGISEDHAFVLHPGASYTIKKVQRSALVPTTDVVGIRPGSSCIHSFRAALSCVSRHPCTHLIPLSVILCSTVCQNVFCFFTSPYTSQVFD